MKINRRSDRIKKIIFLSLLALIILPSTIFLIKNSTNFVQSKTIPHLKIENIEYCFDKIYSENLRQELQCYVADYVAKSNDLWNFDQQALCRRLCDNFKIIKTIDCRIDDNAKLSVKVQGQSAFCFVNKNVILCDSNMLLSPEFFLSLKFEDFNNISINNLDAFCLNGSLNAELCEFVYKITDQHWELFDIDYVNPSEIRLYPKNESFRCILLSSKKTFFDFEKINKALQLYQKVKSDKQIQKKLKYGNNKKLVFDLRFKSSIVTRADEI